MNELIELGDYSREVETLVRVPFPMRVSTIFGTTLALLASIGGSPAPVVQAIQAPDGTVSFEKPPRLIEARTTYDQVYFRGATYYFTLELPENAGEPLKQVSRDEETGAISVIFEQPVTPGNTVTIGLRPRRNPRTGGTYLFGVTAFPAGEKPYGLYLGVGRLHFNDRDGDFLFGI